MADRTCADCGQVFEKPYQLKRHNARIKSCISVTAGKNICSRCGDEFASRSSLSHHRTRCRAVKATEASTKDAIIERLLENQASQNEIVSKFQDQVTSLLTELRGTAGSTAITQRPKEEVVPENSQDSSHQEDDRRPNQESSHAVMTKRKARQVTEVTTKTVSEVKELEMKIIPWDDQNPIRITTEQM